MNIRTMKTPSSYVAVFKCGCNACYATAAIMFIIAASTLFSAANTGDDRSLPDPSKSTGLYADGWIAGNFSTELTLIGTEDAIVIQGMAPALAGFPKDGLTITIYIDGVLAKTRILKPGGFLLGLPIKPGSESCNVRVEANATASLPEPDKRSISLNLTTLKAVRVNQSFLGALSLAEVMEILDGEGVYADGWIMDKTSIDSGLLKGKTVTMEIEIPESTNTPQRLRIMSDNVILSL